MADAQFLVNLNLNGLQLLNVVLQNLATDPGSPVEGQLWYNTTTHTPKYFDGTSVIDLSSAVVSDASTSAKGIVQLAGDIGGSATSVTVVTVGGAAAAAIADAATKKHAQNTDTGTSSATFQLDSGASGPKLKNNSGVLEARDAADAAYADLKVKNLTVTGTTTQIDSNTVNIGDADLLLNSDVAANSDNSDGGISVKRLQTDNTTRADARVTFDNSAGRWKVADGPVASATAFNLTRTYATDVGDGSSTSITVTHNLGTRDVIVQLRDAGSPYSYANPGVVAATTNTVTLTFAVAPTLNQFRAIVQG